MVRRTVVTAWVTPGLAGSRLRPPSESAAQQRTPGTQAWGNVSRYLTTKLVTRRRSAQGKGGEAEGEGFDLVKLVEGAGGEGGKIVAIERRHRARGFEAAPQGAFAHDTEG